MMRQLIASLALSFVFCAAMAGATNMNDKLSPPLRLLLAAHQHADQFPDFINSEADKSEINVSVRLSDPADPALWEGRGLRLRKIASLYAGSGSVYGARMTWAEIERWSQDPEVIMISSDWHPKIVPCLDVSAPEVGAPEVWEMTNEQGLPIIGQGQLVADFDTGIDVFHPAFFRPSEVRYDWLDEDQNGIFTSGMDVVDLDGNGIGILQELLRFTDGQIYDEAMTFGGEGSISNADNVYQSDWDWLYNDADGDGQRDCGVEHGFTENDPGYGERVFYPDDVNGNHNLDLDEQLILLGESKVRAVLDGSGERRRGLDLILAEPDYNGHGTAVSGVLAGGEPGRTRFCGLAPGADLLMGYTSGTWFEEYLPWVRNEGCKVLLYEFGAWIYNPLDGSTNEELLLNSEAAQGVMQVTPSGNLNRGYKHCQLQLAAGDSVPIHVGVDNWQGTDPTWWGCSFLWREPAIALSITLQDPYENSLVLQPDSLQSFASWYVWTGTWVSPRGTAEYDLSIWGITGEQVIGTWIMKVRHAGAESLEMNGYVADDVSAWEGGAEFDDFRSTAKTVTWPATADSAFVLGSYSTRGYEQYVGVGSGSIQVGQISKFSGRGPRLDGVPLLSVISPGNYDVYAARSVWGYPYTHGGWRQFSGTSAAGPHVAASAILAFAADTNLTRITVESLLESFAYQDAFTGSSYNDSAGYGKVRIDELAAYLGVSDQVASPALPATMTLSAYPNPFNATVSLTLSLPHKQKVSLMAYDLMGREVALIFRGQVEAGRQRVSWQTQSVPSGVYWIGMEGEGEGGRLAQKVVVLK